MVGQLTDIAIKSRRDCKLSSLVVQSNRSASANVRAHGDGHALLTHNCLRSAETNARNSAWFETEGRGKGGGPPPCHRWHGPPDGSLEKGDKRITPLVKQNLHYLCRRGSVRYARLCPADLNRLGAANTIVCTYVDVPPLRIKRSGPTEVASCSRSEFATELRGESGRKSRKIRIEGLTVWCAWEKLFTNTRFIIIYITCISVQDLLHSRLESH